MQHFQYLLLLASLSETPTHDKKCKSRRTEQFSKKYSLSFYTALQLVLFSSQGLGPKQWLLPLREVQRRERQLQLAPGLELQHRRPDRQPVGHVLPGAGGADLGDVGAGIGDVVPARSRWVQQSVPG